MVLLIVVSLFWAFSFGLIKTNLQGLDATFVSFARLAISFLVFLPLLRRGRLAPRAAVSLTLLGGVQYGLMYWLYISAYQHLQAYEIALFTVTTPLLVVATEGALARKLKPLPLIAAILAVIGAAVVVLRSAEQRDVWTGFLLLQGSNLCFAVGQVLYRRLMTRRSAQDQASQFALLFGGGVVVTALAAAFTGGFSSFHALTSEHVWTLLYLGVLPSGLAFFLWNVGATRTSPGVLAVMNNAKVPLGVLVSLVVFDERGEPARLLVSLLLLGAALRLAHRSEQGRTL